MLGQAKRLFELNSLLSQTKVEKKGAKIISFSSGKGGTGKSFLSGNIAFTLAEAGKKVLLIDLDLNFSNLSTLFNINSKNSIYHYLTYNKSLSDIIEKFNNNLHLIFGESGKIDHPILTAEKSDLLLSELKNLSTEYDYIFIDTPSGIDNGTLNFLINSDEVILVVTPEPTSIMDSYVILKLLKANGANNSLKAIVNKCFTEEEGKTTFNNLEKAVKHFLKLKVDYLGKIDFSEEIIKSIQNQTMLKQHKNFSQISNQIKKIASLMQKQTIG